MTGAEDAHSVRRSAGDDMKVYAAAVIGMLGCGPLSAQEVADGPQQGGHAIETDYSLIPVETPAEAPVAEEDSPDRQTVQANEIVVTAQKRAEDVRDVPIAITVMNGEELRNMAVVGVDDVARFVPNVSFNTDFNSLYLRGIGTAELNPIGEQAIVYMLDDVYVSRLDFLKPGFLDVGQIEVLKGPQGTLYGRNATGGVVNIGIGQPDDSSWVSRLTLTGGERNQREAEGMVSGPLGERAGVRVAARIREEDGHTRNLHDGTTLGDKDTQQVRVRMKLEATDSVVLTAGVDWFDYFIGVWGGNEMFVYPANLRLAIELLDPAFETKLDRRGSANLQNHSDGHGLIAPLKIHWELGDHEITSITAFAKLDDVQGGDIDGSAIDLAGTWLDTRYDQISQELRLLSPPGDLDYVVGLFYFQSELDSILDVPIGPNYLVGDGLPLLAELPIPGINELLMGATDVLDQILDSHYGSLANVRGLFGIDVDSYGIFGQMTWRPTDSVALILGGRYSSDIKHARADLHDEGPVPVWTVLTQGGYKTRRKAVDKNFSPKLSATWAVDDRMTLYATYAKGFRAGSFNAAAFSEQDFEFDGETSATYEAGVKTSLFDGDVRFNLGGFRTVYRDYQLAAFNGFGYIIGNAEKVKSQGIESDVTVHVLQGLVLQAGVGFNDAWFEKHTGASCPTVPLGTGPMQGLVTLPPRLVCDLSGEPLFRAPRWTGSMRAAYEAPIADSRFGLIVGADATYKGGEYIDSDLDPIDWQDGYWLYNARVGLKGVTDRWRIEVHGKNLSDKLVRTFSGDVPLQAGAHWALTNPPRTFFVTLRLSFE
jgi:outer membrane receptor protein involved in Fe transport